MIELAQVRKSKRLGFQSVRTPVCETNALALTPLDIYMYVTLIHRIKIGLKIIETQFD